MRKITMLTAILRSGCPSHPASSPHWTDPVALPDLGGSADGVVGTNVAVLSSGVIAVFYPVRWKDFADPYDMIQATSTDGGEHWSTHTFPPNPEAQSLNVAVYRCDGMHVVYGYDGDIYYTSSGDGGNHWDSPLCISQSPRYGNVYPQVTVDRLFRVHVMYFDGDSKDASKPGEVWYARYDGTSWSRQMLSLDDGFPSVFPRADFSGVTGDTLAIVWRDQHGGEWNVRGAISVNGGVDWTEQEIRGGAMSQWDPMALVDKHGTIHVALQNPVSGEAIQDRIEYGNYTTATGWIWQPPLTDVLSRFPFFAYDYARDVLWLFWKDERDFDFVSSNRKSDIAGRSSTDGGGAWTSLEFVTDEGEIDVRFPAFAVGADGSVHAIYSRGATAESASYTVYYKRR